MPTDTFFALPAERRGRLVREAIAEFADKPFAEASLSRIARASRIPKGSFYQYFADKLDLYRWLLTDEVPRRKREYLGSERPRDFWSDLETMIERGLGFLVEHPQLARLSAAAADPTAIAEVRGLHREICRAGHAELRALLARGLAEGAIAGGAAELDVATRLVASVIGPGLTELVLEELGAELHQVLASDALLKRLGPHKRRRMAGEAIRFLRGGLGSGSKPSKRKERA
jgi:AcrR family transcriptional regulator